MKIEFTKDWCMRMAALEGSLSITAGVHAKPVSNPQQDSPDAIFDGAFAFGKLIHLLRNSRRLSLEELANKTDIDADELRQVEADPLFSPDPRTVHFLATFFELSKKKLFQLSGLTAANDSHLVDEAIRFAASAKPGVELTHDERKAFRDFIAFLHKE